MPSEDILDLNRVILCHFDSYSTALVFARWPNRSLLAPSPLPESARPMPAPAEPGAAHDGTAVMQAAIERYQLSADDIVHMGEFNEWLQTDTGPLRVHLLRYTTFDAPAQAIEPFEAVFKPISELRGSNAAELQLLRQVFNLIISGGGRA